MADAFRKGRRCLLPGPGGGGLLCRVHLLTGGGYMFLGVCGRSVNCISRLCMFLRMICFTTRRLKHTLGPVGTVWKALRWRTVLTSYSLSMCVYVCLSFNLLEVLSGQVLNSSHAHCRESASPLVPFVTLAQIQRKSPSFMLL